MPNNEKPDQGSYDAGIAPYATDKIGVGFGMNDLESVEEEVPVSENENQVSPVLGELEVTDDTSTLPYEPSNNLDSTTSTIAKEPLHSFLSPSTKIVPSADLSTSLRNLTASSRQLSASLRGLSSSTRINEMGTCRDIPGFDDHSGSGYDRHSGRGSVGRTVEKFGIGKKYGPGVSSGRFSLGPSSRRDDPLYNSSRQATSYNNDVPGKKNPRTNAFEEFSNTSGNTYDTSSGFLGGSRSYDDPGLRSYDPTLERFGPGNRFGSAQIGGTRPGDDRGTTTSSAKFGIGSSGRDDTLQRSGLTTNPGFNIGLDKYAFSTDARASEAKSRSLGPDPYHGTKTYGLKTDSQRLYYSGSGSTRSPDLRSLRNILGKNNILGKDNIPGKEDTYSTHSGHDLDSSYGRDKLGSRRAFPSVNMPGSGVDSESHFFAFQSGSSSDKFGLGRRFDSASTLSYGGLGNFSSGFSSTSGFGYGRS